VRAEIPSILHEARSSARSSLAEDQNLKQKETVMKTLIATLALAALVATYAVAKQPAYLGGNYPCPEYNHTDQTCGVHKKTL
jgi:hypothetical protein